MRMEPVSAAILAAMAAGLTSGAKDAVSGAVADAYGALKSLLRRRFGEDSRVSAAVDELEAQPASKARQAVVQEEIGSSGAAQDAELVAAARSLLDEIAKLPGGEQHVQQATGNYIAQADRAGTASVHVSGPRDAGRGSPDVP
jgi:hypothetical protein